MRARSLFLALLVATTTSVVVPGVAAVPSPTVSGPIGDAGIHGHALFDSPFDLAPFGYRDDEYFVSGTARNDAGTMTAPYTTRIIVTRPVAARRFNGTVLLDWVNVTAQFENAVDTVEAREMLLREGYAYVHASVQAAGICCTPLTPKVWDPVRYGSLSHPGDDFAADIFSQIARAVRAPRGVNPFAGLRVSRVLAMGQSQSADKLATYVRTVQPTARVIDGFLIHGGGSKIFDTPPVVPVLHLLSDEEATPENPNTTTNYRLWEIAGTSHSDFWIGYYQVFGQGPRTLADAERRPASELAALNVAAGNYGEQIHPMQATCILAGGTMPMHYAVSTAIHRLDAWVRTGVAPPNGPRFVFANGQLARDGYGNAQGGIRLPPIDVPIATYESTVCVLGGITVPFSDVQIRLLYPTHAEYYAKMVAATKASVAAGWLLPADGRDMLGRACAAKNRWGDLSGGSC
jgi:Alpha/beta hydrolase domain